MGFLEEQLEKAVAEAKASGKEEFDFSEFCSFYLHDTGNCERLDPASESEATVDYYRRKYYVSFPEVMTVKEFAAELDALDSQG